MAEDRTTFNVLQLWILVAMLVYALAPLLATVLPISNGGFVENLVIAAILAAGVLYTPIMLLLITTKTGPRFRLPALLRDTLVAAPASVIEACVWAFAFGGAVLGAVELGLFLLPIQFFALLVFDALPAIVREDGAVSELQDELGLGSEGPRMPDEWRWGICWECMTYNGRQPGGYPEVYPHCFRCGAPLLRRG